MTENFAELHIDFYSRQEAAIRIELMIKEDYILPYEVMLFNAFTIRQLSNLDGSGIDSILADALEEARNVDLINFNLGDYIDARDIEIIVPKLVSYRGKGDHIFDTTLNILEANFIPLLKLDVEGFGPFGKEVNYYAIQSVNALIRYFAVKYRSNKQYQEAFNDAAYLCAHEFSDGNTGPGLNMEHGVAVMRIHKNIFRIPK